MAWSLAGQKIFVLPFHFNEGKEARRFSLTGSLFSYFWEVVMHPSRPQSGHHLFSCCCGEEVDMAGTRSCWSHQFQNLEQRAVSVCGEHEQSRSHPGKWCHLQGASLPISMNSVWTAKIIPHRYSQSSFSLVISDSVKFSIGINRYDTQAFPHSPRVSSGF